MYAVAVAAVRVSVRVRMTIIITLKYVLNYSRAKNKLFFDPGASFKILVFERFEPLQSAILHT